MYHLSLKGDHYEMGVKRGKIFKKCQVSFPLHLDEFQLEHGKRSEAALRKYFPEPPVFYQGWSLQKSLQQQAHVHLFPPPR